MFESSPTISRSDARRRSLGPIDRLARRALFSRLSSLRSGRLEITDAEGAATLGDPGAGGRATLTVRDGRLYRRAAIDGANGVAAAYIDGWWDAADLTRTLRLFARDLATAHATGGPLSRLGAQFARAGHALRRNTRAGSRRNIAEHYDLGNDLFAAFLDETMTYSAAIFDAPDATLERAQAAKLERLCRKLDLRESDHLLEIGSGWGSMAIHAARTTGCRVTTTTISKEQHELAKRRVEEAGLADRVDVLLRDYRDLQGTYDKLVSIEMIEAVGHDYLPAYFRAISRLLKPHGAAAIQAITMPDDRYERYRRKPDFIQRFVFPGSCCPSHGAIAGAVAASDLRLVHAEELGPHYAETLRRWRARFNENIDRVRELGYPARFERLWNYYLCYCEAGFAERAVGLSQLVYHKPRRDADVQIRPAPSLNGADA
jgi:cyclopropane-fatty-acyl-phospholipid synthase